MKNNSTEELIKEIAELNELAKERTQGNWELGCHPANEKLNIIKPIMFGNRVGKLPECEGNHAFFQNKSDAAFIAEAPRMIEIINQQQARIDELEEMEKRVEDVEGLILKAYKAYQDYQYGRFISLAEMLPKDIELWDIMAKAIQQYIKGE